MGLSYLNLELLKYIQEKNVISLKKVSEHFNKNITSIRREIEMINFYLNKERMLLTKNGYVFSQIDYLTYTSFVGNLTIDDYLSTCKERLKVITIKAFFYDYVNLSKEYEAWNLSLTTKKRDSKELKKLIISKHLDIIILKRKGITITGNDFYYRLFVIEILLPLIEIAEDFKITKRLANTPLENTIVDCLFEHICEIKEVLDARIQNFLKEQNRSLSYSSKKFLLLYTYISEIRKGKNTIIENIKLPIKPLNLYFKSEPGENIAFNQVTTMLDFIPPLNLPVDDNLITTIRMFVNKIQSCITIELYTYEDIIKELYCYIYKQISSLNYGFIFYDKMVKNTEKHIPYLYNKVSIHIDIIENKYNIKFNNEHLSTITLILKKWINKNKVLGKNVKKIVIVTNISYERSQYFIETLKDFIEFELVSVLNINEVYQLKHLKFDIIVNFSDRVKTVINEYGYESVKLNFFLENSDIEKLLSLGLSISRKKFIGDDFSKNLQNKDQSEIKEYLINNYGDYFI